jgi:hypothetical protein
MKTAMQEMMLNIESIEAKTTDQEQIYMLTALKMGALVFLKKEKEQIIDAVNTTERNAVDFCNAAVVQYWNHEGLFDVVPDAGIKYYNEKFKDNE